MRGERCQRGVMRGGSGRFCVAHERGNPQPGKGQRCTAKTKRGMQCKGWATKGSVGRRSQPRCLVHSGWGKRCTATTALGKRCRRTASRGSFRKYGKWLCVRHEPGYVFPVPPEGRRCEAETLAGERCKRWARAREEGGPVLCVAHDVLRGHPNLRHGYYRQQIYLPPEEAARLLAILEEEGEVALAIAVVGQQMAMAMGYAEDETLPLARFGTAVGIVLRLVRKKRKLVMLERELHAAGYER